MKKHLYYFVSSIITILLCVYSIITSNEIVSSIIETAKMLPESMRERVLETYSNNGNIYIIVMSVICILLNFIIFSSIIKKTVTRKKFIITSIFILLTAPIDLISLIAILNLILCITVKNDIVKTKTVIPEIEYKTDKKLIRNSIILILVYISQYLIKFIPFIDKFILSIIFEIVLLILSILLFFNIFKEEFKLFIKNILLYIKYIMPKLGIGYIIYISVSLISVSITKQTTSVNQSALEQLSTWYLIPAAVIWAPIVEETIFRRCLRSFIKNDKLFIILSALVFGLLHTIHEATILNVFVVGLPYIALGGYLAYIYTKTNNLLSNIFSHMFINTLAIIVMIIGI